MQKTVSQIIIETVEYIEKNGRGVYTYFDEVNKEQVQRCAYFYEGKMCAVGRCMINPQNWGTEDINPIFIGYFDEYFDEELKEEYRGHSLVFWCDLQSLHDKDTHWDNNKITQVGLEWIHTLYVSYCKDRTEQKEVKRFMQQKMQRFSPQIGKSTNPE